MRKRNPVLQDIRDEFFREASLAFGDSWAMTRGRLRRYKKATPESISEFHDILAEGFRKWSESLALISHDTFNRLLKNSIFPKV
jgi:hypothetical protein